MNPQGPRSRRTARVYSTVVPEIENKQSSSTLVLHSSSSRLAPQVDRLQPFLLGPESLQPGKASSQHARDLHMVIWRRSHSLRQMRICRLLM